MNHLLVVLAAVSILAGCTTAPQYVPTNAPAAVTQPQTKVGDYWEYAVRDGYTGIPRGIYRYEVTGIEDDRVVVNLTNDGAQLDTLVYACGWHARELAITPMQRFQFEPSLQAFSYPLQPG